MNDPAFPKTDQAKLADKVVLLVGGADVSDQTLAVSLAERGADIAIVYLGDKHLQAERIKKHVEETGQRCLIISPETGPNGPREVIDQIVDDLGRLDIFIDYAALPESTKSTAGYKDVDVSQNGRGRPWRSPFLHYAMVSAALRQVVDTAHIVKNETQSEPIRERRSGMRIAQKLINRPIISVKEGQELGKIQDFYLDRELGFVAAAYLGKEGLLNRKETLIKWENVVTLGADALLVDTAEAVLETAQVEAVDDYIRRDDLIGRPVDTPGGTKIGRVGDIVIDQDASIAGFSLSQTFVSGPIAANRAISRSAMVDTGNEDGTMTAELTEAEEADLKIVFEGLFADPSVSPSEEEGEESQAQDEV